MNKNSKSITVRAPLRRSWEFIREVNGKEIQKFKTMMTVGLSRNGFLVNGNRIGYLAPRKKKGGYLSTCRAFTLFPVI